MKKELVSIIVPVFNTGKSALKILDVLKKDEYKKLEILLIDDGSTDDSLDILKSIQNENIKVFSKKNGGASSARNYGIEKANGEYFIFLDSDDMIKRNYVKKLVEELESSDADLVTTGKLYKRLKTRHEKILFSEKVPERKKNETFKTYILKLMNIDGRMYSVNNKIFKSKIINNHKLRFDENINFAEDTKFVLDYLKYTSEKISFIYKPLYVYYFGTETSTVRKSSLEWKNWETSYKNLKKWVGNHPTKQEKYGLKKIYLRWKISHALAVARSNGDFRQKSRFLNPIFLLPAEIIIKFRR